MNIKFILIFAFFYLLIGFLISWKIFTIEPNTKTKNVFLSLKLKNIIHYIKTAVLWPLILLIVFAMSHDSPYS